MPSVYDGNTLGKELGALLNGTEKILIPRASLGNRELAEELKKTGAQVDDVPTYETGYAVLLLMRRKNLKRAPLTWLYLPVLPQ